jgi:hypothetical protein
MKIPKMVTVEQEIEVEVTTEDIACCIAEETDSQRSVLLGINNCAKFLKAVPDGMIAGLNDKQREVIATFLREQAGRFVQNR